MVVTDNDVGKVWVSPSADSVPESQRACFTLHTDVIMFDVGRSRVVIDVTVAVRQEGDYLAAGEAGQHTVTLEHVTPEYGETAELCLDLVDDDVNEVNGAVVVEVLSTSEGDGVVVDPARSTARVTVVDDEPMYLTLATAATSVDEGGSVTFTLTRDGPVDEPLAVAGPLLRSFHSDQSFLELHREHPVTFAPGSATATFTVTPEDDEVFSVQRDLYVQIVTEFQGVRGGFRLRVPESSLLSQHSSDERHPVRPARARQRPGAGLDHAAHPRGGRRPAGVRDGGQRRRVPRVPAERDCRDRGRQPAG